MKKIPTLFKRVFSEDHKQKSITHEVTQGCEAVLTGECIPTEKIDGACCAIINGEIYKRYDAKQKYGKKPPEGAIQCQPEPDPITGHWPHWVKCEKGNPADKYFLEAFENFKEIPLLPDWLSCAQEYKTGDNCLDGTYEAVGPCWQSNPYGLPQPYLKRHGEILQEFEVICKGEMTPSQLYDKCKNYLETYNIEGIVFWYNGEPLCKIKRSDFGFPWPPTKCADHS